MNRLSPAVIALLLLSLCAASAYCKDGEDRLDTPEYRQCLGQGINMIGCTDAEFNKQDKLLNDTYHSVMSKISGPSRKIELRDAEREWLRRTKIKCDSAGNDFAGGTDQILLVRGCFVSETESRTIFLRSLK